MRYKTLIGRRLHARTLPKQKTEVAIGLQGHQHHDSPGHAGVPAHRLNSSLRG